MNVQPVDRIKAQTIAFSFGNSETAIKLGYSILNEELQKIRAYGTEAIVIADRHVNELWNNEVYDLLSTLLPTSLYLINPKEKYKSLATLTKLLNAIIAKTPSRSCTIISFGGGLTGNIAGVLAGMLFRGVQLVHIPTTLLAMSDSILSQKQAVNGQISKNCFGLYHKAALNILDIKYLCTLPHLQIYSGIIEIIKNCLAFDSKAIPLLHARLRQPFDVDTLQFFVEMGIRQKQPLLQQDPYEKEGGIMLEYGHTIGHALEITSKGLHHGQAVGLGMLAAAYISWQRGWLKPEDVQLHAALLKLARCPLQIGEQVDIDKVMQSVRSDNKKGKIPHAADATPMVLLEAIGAVKTFHGHHLVPAGFDEIREALVVLQTDFFKGLHPKNAEKQNHLLLDH